MSEPSEAAKRWFYEEYGYPFGQAAASRFIAEKVVTAFDAGRASAIGGVWVSGGGDKLSDQINALPEPLRSFIHDLETRCDPAGDLRSRRVAEDAVAAQEAEIARLAAALEAHRCLSPLCDEHGSGPGARSGCPYCSLLELSAALSRIDYLCGPPNEMRISGYDVHCDLEAVVKAVARLAAALKRVEAVAVDRPIDATTNAQYVLGANDMAAKVRGAREGA